MASLLIKFEIKKFGKKELNCLLSQNREDATGVTGSQTWNKRLLSMVILHKRAVYWNFFIFTVFIEANVNIHIYIHQDISIFERIIHIYMYKK